MEPLYDRAGRQRRRDRLDDARGPAARGLRRRRHLRHQRRVRLRLPARQHGRAAGGLRPARPLLLHRGRGRLDPHRRGAHAADHLGRPRGGDRHLLPLRPHRAHAQDRRGLRRGREAPRRVAHRERRRQGREGARHREPLPRRQRQPGQPPDPGAQGPLALPQGQGVHRPRRRAADRRRVHRAACSRGAATPRASTRRSRPRRGCGSARRTRPSRRSPSRTTSACTRSSRA